MSMTLQRSRVDGDAQSSKIGYGLIVLGIIAALSGVGAATLGVAHEPFVLAGLMIFLCGVLNIKTD